MGIRETVNKNPAMTSAVTAGIIVVALAFAVWYQCRGGAASGFQFNNKAFFTTEDKSPDGALKTLFVDDANKIPPFLHDGKQAFRAVVYSCDNGSTKFVSHLEGYSQQDQQRILETMKANNVPVENTYQYMSMAAATMLVKKPGDKLWVQLAGGNMEKYSQVMQARCPDGSYENLQRQVPE